MYRRMMTYVHLSYIFYIYSTQCLQFTNSSKLGPYKSLMELFQVLFKGPPQTTSNLTTLSWVLSSSGAVIMRSPRLASQLWVDWVCKKTQLWVDWASRPMKKRAHSKLLMGNRWPQIPQLLVEIVHHCPISRCKGVWKIRHGWGNREKKHQNIQSTGTSAGCCWSPKWIFKTLVQKKLTPNLSLIRGISHDFPSTSIEDNQISIREVSPSPQNYLNLPRS